ncbi:MAG TPA: hypothetical protein VGF24_20990 [Vicinamibacterales bacterium]
MKEIREDERTAHRIERCSSIASRPITLLGSAAHPMLRHAGQGAAQALEDAVALGLALRGPMMLRSRYDSTNA